jgi:hypothetical protein
MLVVEAGNRSGTQRKENVRRYQATTSEDMTVDTSVYVIKKCKV